MNPFNLFFFVLRVVASCTPFALIAQMVRENRSERFYRRYVGSWLVLDICCLTALVCSSELRGWLAITAATIVTIRLADMMLGFLRPLYGDAFGYLAPLTRIRLLTANVIEVICCFATLFIYYGPSWDPQITDLISGLYQSMVTLSTLGYGDIKPALGPTGAAAKILVSVELVYSMVFLMFGITIMTSDEVGFYVRDSEKESQESGT